MVGQKKLLLLDTNIISHALISSQVDCYIKLFRDLEKGYNFVVTDFTKYELMRSSDKAHRDEIEKYINQNMYAVAINDALMKFSARVYYLYSKHNNTKGCHLSDGDVINAAFSICKNCELLTIDNNDFPRDFFAEVDRHRMKYTSKNSRKETMDVAYRLLPDLDQIKECFEKYNV